MNRTVPRLTVLLAVSLAVAILWQSTPLQAADSTVSISKDSKPTNDPKPMEALVSFQNEVMPILSRGGCNQGACHGNLNGKGGLKLSLRGESAQEDFRTLTREMHGRRLNLLKPEVSLILRKATGQVAHEGGVRFDSQSPEYRLLHAWIRQGTQYEDHPLAITQFEVDPQERIVRDPEDHVQLRVRGKFADGSTRDLSHLVVFEPTSVGMVDISATGKITRQQHGEVVVLVRYRNQQLPVRIAFIPPRTDFRWEEINSTHPIDQAIYPQLKALRLTPSPLSTDSMFLRRIYLDLLGTLPTIEESQPFLEDRSADKRDKLIARLVQRPEFADFWAMKWSDLLRNEEKTLDRKGVRVFHQWIRDSIDQDKPLNRFAQEILAATGSSYQNPPTNFYRAIREPYARAESVAQVFLGIRISCAKCHNHPFDQWTQDEYHSFAAFFSQIDYRVLENNRKDRLDKHEFDGEQIVFLTKQDSLKHPNSGGPLQPKLLGSVQRIDPDSQRLTALADWVGDRNNPFFARAQVNRVWYHLMGKGLVDPIDDFRSTNPSVNQPLLELLSKEFADNNFSLRYLVRRIVTSRIYQLSSYPHGTNTEDTLHFSHALVQPLEAEQLLDGICSVLGTPVKFTGYPQGLRAVQLPAMQQQRRGSLGQKAEQFLKVFGKPERLLTCECERSEDTGVLQAFQLITGELVQDLLNQSDNRLGRWMEEGKSNNEIIRSCFLAALSRYPTTTEETKLVQLVNQSENRRDALEDVVWGLLNSKEFLLRR